MTSHENKNQTFVKIEGNKVSLGFHFHYTEQDGFFNAYIPAFNLAFCTKDESKLNEKAERMAISYARYYLKEEGIKRFALELHKKGFRANMHNLTLAEILHDKRKNANFSNFETEKTPAKWNSQRVVESVGEFEMA